MAVADSGPTADEFALIYRGPSYRLGELLGFTRPSMTRRLAKVAALLAVTWLPLLGLALIEGRALGTSVSVPLLHDPEPNGRFLFVLPLLEFAGGVLGVGLVAQVRQLESMGLVRSSQMGQFQSIRAATLRLRESAIAEGAILILSYGVSLVMRAGLGISASNSSWERVGSSLTAAGWWHALVSLPILFFFLLRWLWIFAVWAIFLFRVSRLELELTATHPDRCGGLGFVGWGLASFAPVLMAVSATFSAGFADEILHHGSSLAELKYHVIVFVVIAMFVLYLPFLSFSGQLARCRFSGLLDFGKLVWDHDRAFDEKWIKHRNENRDSLLGSADIQSLADAATGYEHINEMWLIPFDMKAFAVLMIAALLPMAPLLGTSVPIQEIFLKLGELLI